MSFADLTITDYLDHLAAKTPVPGGGAAVGIAGALATALGAMVVNYTLGKKRYRDHEAELQQASASLARYRELLLRLSDEDAAAYELLNSLMKLDKNDPTRRASWSAAVVAAIRVPQASVACCADLLRLLDSLTEKTNRQLRSDLVVAAILAHAAARSAECNVRINLPLLEEQSDRDRVERETHESLSHAAEFARRIEQACR